MQHRGDRSVADETSNLSVEPDVRPAERGAGRTAATARRRHPRAPARVEGEPAKPWRPLVEFEPIPAVGAKGAIMRNRIAERALSSFADRGFEGTSTRSLADEIGIKHSALLYHFGSKNNLWFYVMEGVIRQYRALVESNLPPDPSAQPEEALRSVMDTWVDFSCQVPQLHKIMIMASTQSADRLSWVIVQQLRPHYELVTGLITTLQKQGKVWPVDPLRLYYSIVGIPGTIALVAPEIEQIAGTHVFSPAEIERTKQFMATLVFSNGPKFRIRVKQGAA